MRANLTCLLLVSCIVVVVSAYFKSASPQNVVASKLFRWRRFGRSVRKWGYKRVEAERTVDSHRERLLGIFKLLDQDKDGHVDINELGNMMTILDEENRSPQEFLDKTDTNGDRLIEFEEFYAETRPSN